jgi:hypothetical protein
LAALTAGVLVAILVALHQMPKTHRPSTHVGYSLTSPYDATTTTATTRPTELHVDAEMGKPVPDFCNFGYRSNTWPPHRDPALAAHLLTRADVPSTMSAYPPVYASNGPSFDEIAVGYPGLSIDEADFAVPHTTEPSSVSEILAKAKSPAAATAQVRFGVDKVYAQCEAAGLGYAYPSFPLPPSEKSFTAFEVLSGSSYSSGAFVQVIGAVGDYVFEVEVGNLIAYPATGTASLPSEQQVVAVVQAATAHLEPADSGR